VSELPRFAQCSGARLVLVNLQPTYLDEQVDVMICGDVAEVLPQIVQACGAPSQNGRADPD